MTLGGILSVLGETNEKVLVGMTEEGGRGKVAKVLLP